MKSMKLALTSLVMTIGIIGFFTPNTASAQYLGEFCLQASPSNEFYRLGISDVGDGHYSVNGRLTDLDDPAQENAVTGSAEIFATKVILTLSIAEFNPTYIGSTQTSMELDPVTLNGTLEGIGNMFLKKTSTMYSEPFFYTVNKIPCP